jgi:predicted dehydrogenase
MTPPLRVGILGAGAAAKEIHAPGYADCPGAVLAGIASRSPARARSLAAEFSIERVHDSPAELLEAGDVEAVSLCTPPSTHRELAERAVAAGKHVLIEKPVAHTLADVAALRRLAAGAPVVVEVVRNERFMDLHRAARDAVSSGAIGDVTAALLFSSTTGPDDWTGGAAWSKDVAQAGGGALLDLGVHKLDLVGWLVGREIVDVTPALVRRPAGPTEGDVEWAGALTAMLDGGIPVSVAASWLGPPDAMLAVICGTRGQLQADGATGALSITRGGATETSRHPAPWSEDDGSAAAMIAAFVETCRGERRSLGPDWDAGTRWALEAYRRRGGDDGADPDGRA